MASRTYHPPVSPPALRAHGVGISQTLLLACGAFGARLAANAVAGALARGVRDGGLPAPDVCVLAAATVDGAHGDDVRRALDGHGGEDVRRLLDELDFDARLRRARAVVVATPRLHERTLAGSVTFEIATRARQGGVPAYAVTAENAFDAFDARILDLQVIVEARSRGALVAAGRRLAGLV